MSDETPEWTKAFDLALTGAAAKTVGFNEASAEELVDNAARIADFAEAKLRERREGRAKADAAQLATLVASVIKQKHYLVAAYEGRPQRVVTVDRVVGITVYFSDDTKVALAEMEECGITPAPAHLVPMAPVPVA